MYRLSCRYYFAIACFILFEIFSSLLHSVLAILLHGNVMYFRKRSFVCALIHCYVSSNAETKNAKSLNDF